MKKLILYIVLFHSFGSYWIFGWAVPGATSIAIDSTGQCTKYEGEVRECTKDDVIFMNNLYEKKK